MPEKYKKNKSRIEAKEPMEYSQESDKIKFLIKARVWWKNVRGREKQKNKKKKNTDRERTNLGKRWEPRDLEGFA